MVRQLAFVFYAIASAQALSTGANGCCFSIEANGGLPGSVKQLFDGQCRVGQSGLTVSQFCHDTNGGLTDGQGRGCIITDLNQFQCDVGKTAQPGFAIGCDGMLALNSKPNFIACPTQQNGGYKIYTAAPRGQDGCVQITLRAPNASCKAPCPSPTPPSPPTPLTKSCPTELTGTWEYPHLIIPVDYSAQNTAYGSQCNGTVSSTVSSIFNFDVPGDAAGKTCSLIFLFPEQSQLETSAYDLFGDGVIDLQRLSAPATERTTYVNQPGPYQGQQTYKLTVAPGHSYDVTDTTPCPAGQRIAYKMSSPSGTHLSWFQDYNPSPIGLYITIC